MTYSRVSELNTLQGDESDTFWIRKLVEWNVDRLMTNA